MNTLYIGGGEDFVNKFSFELGKSVFEMLKIDFQRLT